MTKLQVASKIAEFMPVKFVLYNLYEYGKKKGQPNVDSYVVITLQRSIPLHETVADCIKRLKDMIGPKNHFKLHTAQETDEERAARRKRDNLVVVESAKTNPITIHAADDGPVYPIEEVEVSTIEVAQAVAA